MPNLDFDSKESEFQKALDFLSDEISKLRSGRANPDLLSGIVVEAYGQKMPINQLANINAVDATLLTVKAWDKSQIQEIEKAIRSSDVGINPVVDGEIIRLPLPPLTEERREEYVKILKQKAEEARISIRQIRKEVLEALEKRQEDGELSEDQLRMFEKQLQERVDYYNDQVERMVDEKQKDLMSV